MSSAPTGSGAFIQDRSLSPGVYGGEDYDARLEPIGMESAGI